MERDSSEIEIVDLGREPANDEAAWHDQEDELPPAMEHGHKSVDQRYHSNGGQEEVPDWPLRHGRGYL